MMHSQNGIIEDLSTLNQIAETLNRATDVQSALNTSLAHLVELMGLETGWIFLLDPSLDFQSENPFLLVAHHNLPPGIAPDDQLIWSGGCECQDLCKQGKLARAYNEVRCTRLASAEGDRRGLIVHASTPLRSGDHKLGILNVAGEGWSSFTTHSLALLTNVGNMMGIALERARLFDLLREKRVSELAALLEMSKHLLSRLNLEDLKSYLVSEIGRLLECDACTIFMYNDSHKRFDFVAASGWTYDPVVAKRHIPFEADSGPGWVMQTQHPLLVEDLQTNDPTSWTPEWLRKEGFRGHAVVPLIVEDRSIGALAINSREPRMLSEDELNFLQLMANQAAIAIETNRLYLEEIEQQRIEEELAVGRQIQLSLLPKSLPTISGWEFAVHYEAAHQVGGDFYDLFELPKQEDQIGLLIGDVSGKGVPAAMFMAMCRTMIRSTVLSGRSPSQALIRANELIQKDSQADLFLSAIYASLNTRTGHLTYANAGHNRPILLRANVGKILDLTARGIILGEFEEIELEEDEVELLPGDVLVCYTDGVTDAINAQNQPFSEQRLSEVISSHPRASAEELLSLVLDELRRFTGDTAQTDDLTLVIVRRQPEA
jgi:serine phosphatase RsbU (regulator of sigma subunit)